jgi:hypothetical protein
VFSRIAYRDKKWGDNIAFSCNVTIMFYGDAKYSAKDAMSMQALGEV